MTGVVYDINENSRLQNYVDQQQELFKDSENSMVNKEYLILSSVILASSVIIILLVKKFKK